MTNRSDGLTRTFPPPRPRSRTALRVRRAVAVLVVLVGLAVGVDYGAAALAESAVSRHMRAQLNLVDDPSVRFNNFPFLAQVVAGTYRSVDVTAEHISVGPLRDVQLRTQLRGVQVPLSELLGGGPRTVTVREAEGTVRIGPPDVERLLTGVDKLWIDNIDATGLEEAVEDGADPVLARIDPTTAARIGGTVQVLGEEQPVSAIAVLELTDGQVQIVPRDVRVGDTESADLPAAAQRTLSRLFTIRLDPGDLPLDVTPTKARVSSGGLEISGLTGRLVLGAGAPAA